MAESDSSARDIKEPLISSPFTHAKGDGLAAFRASSKVALAIDTSVDPLIGTGAGKLHPEPRTLVGEIGDDFARSV